MENVNGIYVPDGDVEWTPKIKAGKHKWYMEAEIQCALKALAGRELNCAVDVGAHIGLFSRRIDQYFQHTVAFEPFEDTCKCLIKNVPSHVTIKGKAVGKETGILNMCDPNGQKKSGHRRHVLPGEETACTVDMVSLDWCEGIFDYAGGLQLLKIDVQGMEWEVIDGAMETLRKHRPVIILEEHDKHSTTRAFKTTGRILQEIGGDLMGLFKRNVVIKL